MLSFKFPINATTNQRGFFFIFFHIVLKNYISPHNQTNQHIRGSSILLAPCFLAFPFSFLSSSQVPLSLSFSHAPIHSLTTVVVSFESKRIIKMLKSEKEELTVFATSLLFTDVQSFHSTPLWLKRKRGPYYKGTTTQEKKRKKKKKNFNGSHIVYFFCSQFTPWTKIQFIALT